jgi:site-specific recombinase XerD
MILLMASFRFEISNKPTRNRVFPLYLVVSIAGQRKRIKTSVAVRRKSDFNSKAKQNKWIRPSEPLAEVWNKDLARDLEIARIKYEKLKNTGQVSSEVLKKEIEGTEVISTKELSFLSYAKQRTEEILQLGQISNWKKYNGFCNKLEGYLIFTNKKDLTFEQITPSFIAKFHSYLSQLPNERQPEKLIHQNTVHIIIRIFKTLVRRATEIEGIVKYEINPFQSIKANEVPTTKDKLDLTEIKMIGDLVLERGSLIWHCRNYFLFSFYCAGIRARDLIQLRWGNITSEGRLVYTMGKNHKFRELILIPQAKEILSYYHNEDSRAIDYIFPMLDNSAYYSNAVTQAEKDTLPLKVKKKLYNQISTYNALINKYLKKIALLSGIDKNISFHIARHSFAKVAKQKGIDNYVLKSMLNHSSLSVTEIYMRDFDNDSADKALLTMFDNDNNKDAIIKEIQK